MQKTPLPWVPCVSAAQRRPPLRRRPAFSPCLLRSSGPSPPPPVLLQPSFSLSSSTRSLKVSFAPPSAVRYLFENRLPSGLKLRSSLCLPRPPPSTLPSFHLSSLASLFHYLFPRYNRFQDPSIENSHLHCFPLTGLLSSYHCWSSGRCSQEAEMKLKMLRRRERERKQSEGQYQCTHLHTDTASRKGFSVTGFYFFYQQKK